MRKAPKLKYSIKNSAEFERLVKALSDDVVDAHIHFRLYEDLIDALTKHPFVEIQSRTFWGYSLQAHLNSTLYSLFRAYDQDLSSLHLLSWLTTIKQNLHLFDKASFRQRLKGNPHVDTLAKKFRKPSAASLAKDIAACTTGNRVVKKLIRYRGSRIAHRNAKIVIAARGAGHQSGLTFDDLRLLLKRSSTILNRYSYLFSASL